MQKGSMPKPSAAAVEAFRSIVPVAPGVAQKPMFGNQAAFVNGNMFCGLFGDDLFVRLPESRLQELLASGGRPFEPMPGRAMKGYAYVPGDWRSGGAEALVGEALEYVAALPPKPGR
jgi:TfoX/Sxy family transcriptional regulator of competence genes